MLIGTEALRESITKLRDRLDTTHSMLSANDFNLQINSRFNGEVGDLLGANAKELTKIDSRIYDLEAGYETLNFKQAIDREAVLMMCHQYAYARTIPDECQPFLSKMAEPVDFAWHFPSNDCPPEPQLPPFSHPMAQYEAPTIRY